MTAVQRSRIQLAPRLDEVARAVAWASKEVPAWVDPIALDVGLTEALTNAIVHGVLEVSSELRGAGVEVYLGEVERRSKTVDESQNVSLTLSQSIDQVEIHVSWQGASCPGSLRNPPDFPDPLRGSGLGTTLIYASFDEVTWGVDGCSMFLKFCSSRKGIANAPL